MCIESSVEWSGCVHCSKVLSQHLPDMVKEHIENRKAGVQAQILIWEYQNMKLECQPVYHNVCLNVFLLICNYSQN